MADAEYAVRINVKDGAVEVTGPDKDWVDAKLEQLTGVFSDYEPPTTPEADPPGAIKQKPAKRRRKAASTSDAAPAGSSPRRRGTGGRAEVNESLKSELNSQKRDELKRYIAARRKAWDGSQSAQAAIVATFLNDELGIEGIDQHDLYTVYTVMGERLPGNIRSQLTNARQRARYFSGSSDGRLTLSHAGENFARHDALDGDDGDD